MNENEKNLNPANDEAIEIKEESTSPEAGLAPEGVTEPSAPEAKKVFGKKTLLVSVAAVCIAIAAIVASVAASSPLGLVRKGFANSVNAFKQNSVVVFADKVAKGGSIEAVCDMEELMDLPVEGALSLKLYTDTDKAALAADVKVDGEAVLDASAFIDTENIAVASEVLFGSEAYGIDLTDFVEKFNASEFGPNGEFSLGLDLRDATQSVTEDAVKLAKDGQAVAKDLIGCLFNSIEKNTEVSKGNETVSFNGEEVKVTAVEIQTDGEALAAVVCDLVEFVRSDKGLKEFLYDYADYSAAAMVESDLVYGDYEDPKAIIDSFYEQLEDIGEEEMESFAEEMKEEDLELSLTFYITKSGKELVGIKFDGDADGDEVKAAVYAGPSWKNLEEISVRVDDGYTVYRIAYTVETNDKKEYSAELKVREDNENILAGEFVWDKEKGDFEVALTDDWGDTVGLEGSLEVDSKSAVIVLDSAYEDYYEVDLGTSLIITKSDKMPKMPAYTEILAMNADEIEEVVYGLEDVLDELSDMLYYY